MTYADLERYTWCLKAAFQNRLALDCHRMLREFMPDPLLPSISMKIPTLLANMIIDTIGQKHEGKAIPDELTPDELVSCAAEVYLYLSTYLENEKHKQYGCRLVPSPTGAIPDGVGYAELGVKPC